MKLKGNHLEVHIDAPFHHDPPPSQKAGRLWELWNYEVVEFFLVGKNGHYLEAEFGPHGHHLLLKLDRPRNIVEENLPVQFSTKLEQERWTGHARLSDKLLPKEIEKANFYAIHGTGKSRRYLSWSPLPGKKPDFHQPQVFPKFSIT